MGMILSESARRRRNQLPYVEVVQISTRSGKTHLKTVLIARMKHSTILNMRNTSRSSWPEHFSQLRLVKITLTRTVTITIIRAFTELVRGETQRCSRFKNI